MRVTASSIGAKRVRDEATQPGRCAQVFGCGGFTHRSGEFDWESDREVDSVWWHTSGTLVCYDLIGSVLLCRIGRLGCSEGLYVNTAGFSGRHYWPPSR